MCTCIYFLIEIFIILDHDTVLSEGKEAKSQSERKQLGKVAMIIMCTIVSPWYHYSEKCVIIATDGHIVMYA